MKEKPTLEHCNRCAHRVAALVIVGSLFLGVFKVSMGICAQSASVTADGLESFAVAISAIFVWAGLKFRGKPADYKFPYGYGKVEFLVSVISYAVLFGLGLFMAIGSGCLLVGGRFSGPTIIGLPVAAISILGTYVMYSACRCAGRTTGSAGLLASAQQNLADTLTSIAVLISVALAQLGPAFYWCDSAGAGLVGLLIMKDAGRCWWSDMRVLADLSLPQGKIGQIRTVAVAVDGVTHALFVRARRTGQHVRADLGLLVPGDRTVSEAQRISRDARGAILRRLHWVEDIEVFVYPTVGES